MKVMKYPLRKICNIKGSLLFCPYRCPDVMKELSGNCNIQRCWKEHQGVIHNTYHDGNIETDYCDILLMT